MSYFDNSEEKQEETILYWYDRVEFFCEYFAQSFPDRFENGKQAKNAFFYQYSMSKKFINVDSSVTETVGFWWGFYYFISKEYCREFEKICGDKLDFLKEGKRVIDLFDDLNNVNYPKRPKPVRNPNWSEPLKKEIDEKQKNTLIKNPANNEPEKEK